MRPSFEHRFIHRAAGTVILLDWPVPETRPRGFRQRLRDTLTGARAQDPWENVDARSFEAAVDLLHLDIDDACDVFERLGYRVTRHPAEDLVPSR